MRPMHTLQGEGGRSHVHATREGWPLGSPTNSTGFLGVSHAKEARTYNAKIAGKALGYFTTVAEAAEDYGEASNRAYGTSGQAVSYSNILHKEI